MTGIHLADIGDNSTYCGAPGIWAAHGPAVTYAARAVTCQSCIDQLAAQVTVQETAPCSHPQFDSTVEVTHGEGSDFTAAIKVRCARCWTPFRWAGVAAIGSLAAGPAVSPDRTELRAPIEPAAGQPWPPPTTTSGAHHDPADNRPALRLA